MKTWDINYSELENYQPPTWDENQFHEFGEDRYGIYFYAITEMRMCFYGSKIAVYQDKAHPKILFNPDGWFSFQFESTFYYMPLSNCLVLRSLVYGNADIIPFLIVDLENRQVAYVHWDFTSIYLKCTELVKGKLLFSADDSSFYSGPHQEISLAELKWFPFHEYEKASQDFKKNRKILSLFGSVFLPPTPSHPFQHPKHPHQPQALLSQSVLNMQRL